MHDLTPAQAIAKLSSNTKAGLTEKEAIKRIKKYGQNSLPIKKRSLILLFLKQWQDTMVYILLGALALSSLMPFFEGEVITLGSFIDAFVILAILLINSILGFIQEFKAEQAIEHLKKLSSPQARVRRNGKEKIIASEMLVPGDIVILETGDKVSADGRLIEESFFEVNESSLTGESQPSKKTLNKIKASAQLADRENMVFCGTLVTAGSAEYLVTDTGLNTQIGKIASLVAKTKLPETPLARRIKGLGRMLGLVVILLCALIFALGIFRGIPLGDMLLIGVSLAVSAVPEGLPAVITVCLALGVRFIADKNVLVRRMESLETLGSVTVICSDKTGTITENRMAVTQVWTAEKRDEKLLAQVMASCNRAKLPDLGDPTEVGLLRYADSKGVKRLMITKEEVPFTSEKKYMQTRHSQRSFIKGAPEKVIEMCTSVNAKEVHAQNELMAKKGLRVLAGAIKEGGKTRFIGLMGLEDPPRKTVKHSLAEAAEAGIRTIMITGDNLLTAKAIAADVGIKGEAMLGSKLDKLSKRQLAKCVKTVSVYARVSPQHKLLILKAMEANGEVVAMTGDGVNDAPALKGAHVGVAMGKNGTQVAREAASVVLADDHYGSIVTAVREGRRIYENIRKFVVYLLRTNLDEILIIMTAILIGMPLPFLPVHILLLNLMTDSLPALALAAEPAEPDIMKRPPRPQKEALLAGEWDRLLIAGVLSFLGAFIIFTVQLRQGVELPLARSVTVTFAIMLEFFAAFSMRTVRPIWQVNPFSNKWLIWAVAIPFTGQLILLYTPLNTLFSFVPIGLNHWAMIFGMCLIVFLLFELMKFLPGQSYLVPKKLKEI